MSVTEAEELRLHLLELAISLKHGTPELAAQRWFDWIVKGDKS